MILKQTTIRKLSSRNRKNCIFRNIFFFLKIRNYVRIPIIIASTQYCAGGLNQWNRYSNEINGKALDRNKENKLLMRKYPPEKTKEYLSSVAQSCPTLCSPMDCSTPDFPVHHQLPEFAQTHVHWVGDAIQPSHLLSSPSPPAFNLS